MMPTVKQLLQGVVERLPDDCDWPQVHYHLYVAKRSAAGCAMRRAGKAIRPRK